MRLYLGDFKLIKSSIHKESIVQSEISIKPSIPIFAAKICKILFTIIALLVIASLATLLVTDYFDVHSGLAKLFFRLFNLDEEANIPSLFSSIELLFASLLLFLVSKLEAVGKRYWLFLGGVFLYLCIDETAQLHEIIIGLKSRFEILNASNMRTSVWVIPYGFGVVMVGIALVKFIFVLPPKTRNLFILSGLIFVGGAAGIEVLEEQFKILHGDSYSLTLKLLYHLEELCEMSGVAIFIYGLLKYIHLKYPHLSVEVN
jgi:hypothetical protein